VRNPCRLYDFFCASYRCSRQVLLLRRSLVLGPTDEVEATIKLSALSRQAKAYLLAERTLLDPLARMKCSLDSRIFGIGLPPLLGIGLTMSLAESMELIVNGDISVQMNYKPRHERLLAELVDEAGGKERYVSYLFAISRLGVTIY
jgi:hypothetical protein